MVKTTIKTIAFLVLLSCRLAFAGPQKSGFHTFIGARTNYVFPGTIRLGYNEWEFGQIASNMNLGVAKKFLFKQNFYTQFGFGFGGSGSYGFALSSALGAEYNMFWGLGFRVEIIGVVSSAGYAGSGGNIGFTYDF